jgi:hypothetical protein
MNNTTEQPTSRKIDYGIEIHFTHPQDRLMIYFSDKASREKGISTLKDAIECSGAKASHLIQLNDCFMNRTKITWFRRFEDMPYNPWSITADSK